MITFKLLQDGSFLFSRQIEEKVDDKIEIRIDMEFSVQDTKELIELARAVTMAKFAWCDRFKCRLDSPACH